MSIFDVNPDNLFIASGARTNIMRNLALRALNDGLEKYVAKKYDEAIASLKRAASLDPKSNTSLNAYDYMARAYSQLGDNDAAIRTYKQSLRVEPNQSDIQLALGNVYFMEDRVEEAVAAYEKATQLDPNATNRYSLAQGYLALGRYEEAERQFEAVKKLTPREPEADVGLGQTYAKLGRTEDALRAFQQAIDLQRDYWTAYSEMGYALVDGGEIDRAREILETLEPNAAELANGLSQYIYEKAAPRMTAAYTDDRFTPFFSSKGPGTKLTDLSPKLTDPGSEHLFSMVFGFSKPMDRESVQDINNWMIGRAYDSNLANSYNFGNPVPLTEVMPASKPVMVFYNDADRTATVLFSLRQNDAGNGTLDPSHIQFTFAGKDVLGLAMDGAANDYTGFSGVA
jgi:Flp pilus assembly protein TadD